MLRDQGFADRADAGRHLAGALSHLECSGAIVLALPRGGVVVGAEVARGLGLPLDVVVVCKIGAPHQPELGIGALVGGAVLGAHQAYQRVIDERLAHIVGADDAYIERETARQAEELSRRERVYRGDRPRPALAGRTIVLTDDGIATGSSIRAALLGLRGQVASDDPGSRIVLAVPVASPDAVVHLRPRVDELVCLLAPSAFRAVGQFYADFGQTTDDEVVRLLGEAAPDGA